MQEKRRTIKLYKSKKLWVTAGVAVAVLSFSQKANADTTDVVNDTHQNSSQTNTTNQADKTTITADNDKPTVSSSQSDTKSVNNETTSVKGADTSTKNDTSVQNASTDAKATDKVADDTTKTTTETNVANKATDDATKTTTESAKTVNPTVADTTKQVVASEQKNDTTDSVTKNDDANTSAKSADTTNNVEPTSQVSNSSTEVQTTAKANDSTSVQTQKNGYQEVDGQTYYFDKTTGTAVTGIQQIDGQTHGFDSDGRLIKNGFATAPNGDKYYFDQNNALGSGIQQINGNTYYIDSTGRQLTNYTAVIDGVVTYFGKDGIATNTDASQIKTGVTIDESDYTAHNGAYDTSDKSFDNVNGYLTAESWYRPKEILDNGTTWRESTPDEKRPVLMTWQPDITTEANYLNTMADNGLLSIATPFTVTSDLSTMNSAVQAVQKNIEQRITQEQSTVWLKSLMTEFVNSQPQWNETSETPAKDHLQGGALTFVNSPLTPDSNSNFRLLNRTPTNQSGVTRYDTDKSKGGFELLLANDVDNSNPTVQAEQLNWLYYLTHFGSITANDDTANFDGIRIDAVDNVDADLLQIAGDYFKQAYGTNQSDSQANARLSLLEDWSHNDPEYIKNSGSNQLTMDDYTQTQLLWSLTKKPEIRANMSRFLEYYMVNRANDSTENEATPNYSFVRAHDSEVQTIIAQIVSDLHPDVKNSLAPTQEQLAEAFKVYDEDMTKTDKQYTQFNMPSAYAMLLTNKDTIPRVYYGDLYTDDGQYMATKTPYYDTIANLMQSRIKYVAGGQTMATDANDILTSVRFGKDLSTADDVATSDESRNSGIGIIVSNNPNLELADTDQVVLHMGKAHANQQYQQIVTTTKDGIDNDVTNYATTDVNGDLIFSNDVIKGYTNPQVSGYLAVWVPVGADENQDVRTQASTDKLNDGSTLHSNSALDSNVIYEGFSNFQSMPTTTEEYANVKIAENAELFKSLGITTFQMAPQYRSSTDSSFLDSIIQNGYAFTDRYDLGFNTPTKYGTDEQLRTALKSLHASGLQVMADWVPDQIYNLPESELITVSRTDAFGTQNSNSDMSNVLYVSQTKGGGAYQAKYGGEFLSTLKAEVPDLFKTIQVSTGVPIDGTTKIKEWSAKYFNGSDIQGRGAGYVLSDGGTQNYFKVTSNSSDTNFLPTQLTGQATSTGFESTTAGIVYYSKSGIMAKNQFVKDDTTGNYYYFNRKGVMTFGAKTINGANYMFLPNGVELRKAFLQSADGTITYYGANGKQVVNAYVTDDSGNSYYFDDQGELVVGNYTVDGHAQTFGANGVQIKGEITLDNGKLKYFDTGNGNLVTNRYVSYKGQYYYADKDGYLVTGLQSIKGKQQYFANNGQQVKDQIVTIDGSNYYFDSSNGDLVQNRFVEVNNQWYYANEAGKLVTGYQTINNQKVYFNADGTQVKGLATINGSLYYFDENSGAVRPFEAIRVNDKTYYTDDSGAVLTGAQTIDGHAIYLDEAGQQVKGQRVTVDGFKSYYRGDNGFLVTSQFIKLSDTEWGYADAEGHLATGWRVIDGKTMYFNEDGSQVKNAFIRVDGKLYGFDGHTGGLITNNFFTPDQGATWYHADENGVLTLN